MPIPNQYVFTQGTWTTITGSNTYPASIYYQNSNYITINNNGVILQKGIYLVTWTMRLSDKDYSHTEFGVSFAPQAGNAEAPSAITWWQNDCRLTMHKANIEYITSGSVNFVFFYYTEAERKNNASSLRIIRISDY